MSTWKNFLDVNSNSVEHWVRAAFGNSGFRGKIADVWKTDPGESWINNSGLQRGDEVRMYLEDYGSEVKDFILFDDNKYNFKEALGKQRLVWTDAEEGLLYKHMKIAASLMGAWDKK
jgi:hypothetical protein